MPENLAPVPSGWIEVPDSGMYYDPANQTFMTHGETPQVAPNQWSWGDLGLGSLGGSNPSSILDPFLKVRDEYTGGAPIQADTWQDAVRKSLEGFMRAEYGYQLNPYQNVFTDPIFNWDAAQSGQEGSQFRMGTMQELANTMPNFYATGGIVRDLRSGGEVGTGQEFDPLLGLQSSDKLLAFEDIPFEQIEKLVGNMPGEFYDQRAIAPFQRQINELTPQIDRINQEILAFRQRGDFAHANALLSQVMPLAQQRDALFQQIQNNSLMSLDEARTQSTDFNDFLFKLNIDQYAPPAPIIRATPESVLEQLFDTPAYRLAFGSDPAVLDASLDPTQRFRAEPGYQFAQDEGRRQLQFDQSKRGLLGSGRGMRDVQQFSQGLADQNYQRWLAQNMGIYQDWTNRIQGLTNIGAAASGQMSANDMTLAQLLGGGALQTGTNLANLTGQTGTNIANLFGNQGVFGASSLLNTGAAQASNIMQSAAIQAQIAAANASAQAAGAGSSGGGSDKGGAGQAIGQIGSLVSGGKGG